MALFGNKDDENKKSGLFTADDVDDKLLAAIEETDAEIEKVKADARKNELDRIAKQDRIRELNEKMKDMPNQGRRAYMMVREVTTGDNSVTVRGSMIGQINVGDTAYIYRPGGTVVESKVSSIAPDAERIREIAEINGVDSEANANIPDMVEAIKDSPIFLTLDVDFEKTGIAPEKMAPLFTVVSLVLPNTKNDPKAPVENPALLGMTLEYGQYSKDKEYMNHLLRHLVNARFVLPAHTDEEHLSPEGKKGLKLITMKNKRDENTLPVFTDLGALSAWKGILDQEKKPSLVVMTFPDLVDISTKQDMGFTINAFGPVAIEIPRKLIDVITASRGYQNQFGGGAARAKYRKETITDGSKIVVGEVPNIAESRSIKDAFKAYGEAHPEINSIGLLAMRREGKNSYLAIVDCPKGVSREIFGDLYKVAKPFMTKVKDMNFSLYAETVFADQYFADHTFDYVKNPNI